jgi:hypothetical protein
MVSASVDVPALLIDPIEMTGRLAERPRRTRRVAAREIADEKPIALKILEV